MKFLCLFLWSISIASLLFPCVATASDSYPSYQIAALPEKYQVQRGEEIPVEIFFSGHGNVTDAKFVVYSDNSVILRGENSKHRGSFFAIGHIDTSQVFKPLPKIKGIESGILVSEVGSQENVHENEDGSTEWKKKPVFLFHFSSQRPGNHVVRTILTYKGGNGPWQTASLDLRLHVTSWFEDNVGWIAFLGLLFAVPLWGVIIARVRKLFELFED